MKVDSAELRRFIKKASLNSHIMTINMDFSEDGLKSSVKDFSNVALTNVFMNKDKFIDYEAIGEVYIKNTKNLIAYLNTFGTIVTLEKSDEYTLKIYDDKREAQVLLGAEIVCTNIFRGAMPELEFSVSDVIHKRDVMKSLSDMGLLGINQVNILKEGKEMTLAVGEKGDSDYFVNKIVAESESKGHVKVGATFIRLVETLDADFQINFGQDIPMVVKEEHEGITFTCFIAPMVEN